MGRISKVRELDLERQVMELRQKGLGAVTIARRLNEEYKLEGSKALIPSNVDNFLKTISQEAIAEMKQKDLEELVIEPAQQLKQDLAQLRGPLFQKANRILLREKDVLTKDEINSLNTFLSHYEEVWNRIAKIENILKPEENIKAKNVVIIQQFNEIKEMVSKIVLDCPHCGPLLMQKLNPTPEPILAEVKDVPPVQ